VNQKFVAGALSFDDETFVTIRTQADDFANDSVARDFDGRQLTLRAECQNACSRRCN
jgi:hypothetical protein